MIANHCRFGGAMPRLGHRSLGGTMPRLGAMHMELDRRSPVSLARQIFENIRKDIIGNRLPAGEQLPSTRRLAEMLGVSRNTATEAYEQLKDEGYILSRPGAAAVVAENLFLPDRPEAIKPRPGRDDCQSPPLRRHNALTGTQPEKTEAAQPGFGGGPVFEAGPAEGPDRIYDFRTGRPAVPESLRKLWCRLSNKILPELPEEQWLYGHHQGLPELRREISRWLYGTRGLEISPDEVYISSGASQALNMILRIICSPGDRVALENPCHLGIWQSLNHNGLRARPTEVDAEGLKVESLDPRDLSAVYVTPSHQFPLGHILSAARRVELIKMARKNDFYLIEDDYDSEFRYRGLPVSPLYSLDPQRVIYLGTFSKCLFPALRIGFAAFPRKFRDQWLSLRRFTDIQNPMAEQAVAAEFLRQRKLGRHINKMAGLYASRLAELKAALARTFGRELSLFGGEAGLHIAIALKGRDFDASFQSFCAERGLLITPCSLFSLTGSHRDILILGYGRIEKEDIAAGVESLKSLIRQYEKQV